jgi:gluconate kinase
MLIHLNGMRGVGKLSVAKILAERLPAHLVDNHSLINAAYASGYAHQDNEIDDIFLAITHIVYDGLANNNKVKTIIMTNIFTHEADDTIKRFNDILELSQRRKDFFVPILLTCEAEENIKRATTPSRAELRKLIDVDLLRGLLKGRTLYHPDDHPNALTIDTTHNTPEETAQIILDHVIKIMPGVYPRIDGHPAYSQ